eukprot:4044774-Pleurochrysis_carterae.AAC.1
MPVKIVPHPSAPASDVFGPYLLMSDSSASKQPIVFLPQKYIRLYLLGYVPNGYLRSRREVSPCGAAPAATHEGGRSHSAAGPLSHRR